MSLRGKAYFMLCVSINYHSGISLIQPDLTYGRTDIGDSTSAPAGSKSQTANAESAEGASFGQVLGGVLYMHSVFIAELGIEYGQSLKSNE
ncbi:hypothetical protein BCON_0096g00240 [Botryotinia convoluta]|uniref:Uncharacterized protein n=1 Tax=Botryotinia convoluta TaxID=54673 RepID=A0A4Z1I0Z9_9HELO|nr:hypothetical protein BCON_0096g00240 [Botryotinia convoluta]